MPPHAESIIITTGTCAGCGAAATTWALRLPDMASIPSCEPCLRRGRRRVLRGLALRFTLGIFVAFAVCLAMQPSGWLALVLPPFLACAFLLCIWLAHRLTNWRDPPLAPLLRFRIHFFQRGAVADMCLDCLRIRPFTLFDHFHLTYAFEMLVSWRYAHSSRVCMACAQQSQFELHEYPHSVGMSYAPRVTMEEGLRRTNARWQPLFEAFDHLRTLRERSAYRSPDVGAGDGLIHEAAWWYDHLIYERVNLEPFAHQLLDWERLSADQRSDIVDSLAQLGRSLRVPPPVRARLQITDDSVRA